jgi:DNA adenine methylase
MLSHIIELFPPNVTTYLEAYGGAGSVLLAKPRHSVEIYNDLEQNVYSLMKVLSTAELFEQFRLRAELALYDETTGYEFTKTLRYEELDTVDRAFMFWYINRTRVNGVGGFSINTVVRRNMSKSVSDMLSSVDRLEALHNRLSSVIVCNKDALELIPQFDRPDTLMYLDPPYALHTRGSARYTQDATDEHHMLLVERLLAVNDAKILLSGYDTPFYAPLVIAGWQQRSWTVNTVDGNRQPKQKTECVWMNYEPQRRLL